MPVRSVDEAALLVRRVSAATVVLDVEPMIAPWRGSAEAYLAGARRFLDAIVGQSDTVTAIVIASNSPATRPAITCDVPLTLSVGAGKPWRTDYLADLPRPVVVIGDQPLTDGLLAWRLDGVFLHWRHDGPTPWWPRLQRTLGRLVLPFAFTRRFAR